MNEAPHDIYFPSMGKGLGLRNIILFFHPSFLICAFLI